MMAEIFADRQPLLTGLCQPFYLLENHAGVRARIVMLDE